MFLVFIKFCINVLVFIKFFVIMFLDFLKFCKNVFGFSKIFLMFLVFEENFKVQSRMGG